MRIVLLEDDYLQSSYIESALKRDLADCEIKVIKTESEFREKLDELIAWKADALILDVMVRWADPSSEMPEPPEEVKTNGYYRAGIRCIKLLQDQNSTVPILLYSVLEKADVNWGKDLSERNITHLSKQTDIQPLISWLKDSIDPLK